MNATSSITASSITTNVIANTTGNMTIGQNTSYPNRSIEIGTDSANTVYFDFHSSDSVYADYSTRIQSIGGSTIGQGQMLIQASTIGILGTSGVGIGTTNPIGYKLCVEQGISNNNGIIISNSNYGSQQQFQLSMVNAGSGNFYSYAMVQTNTAGVAATVPLCLQPNSANVGIGTTAPTAKLQIYGAGQSTGLSDVYSFNISSVDSFNGNGGTTVYSESINMKAGDLTWSNNTIRVYGSRIYIGGGYSINGAQNQGNIIMYTGNAERARISDVGYMGIGTPTPTAYLSLYSASAGNMLSISGYSNTSIAFYDGLRGYSSSIAQKGQSTSDCALQFYNSSPGLASGSPVFTFLNTSVSTVFAIYNNGNVSIPGTLSKGGGTFDIQHPLSSTPTKRLVHSFIEGPRCDLIYRGKKTLINGMAIIDINKECTQLPECSMDDGTFEALCANVDIFLQNNTSFSRIIGSITGGILSITCENTSSNDVISWMVVGERSDPFIKQWDRTDPNGYLITQYTKEIVEVIP